MLRHGGLKVSTAFAAVGVLHAIAVPAATIQPRVSVGQQDYEISFSDVTSGTSGGGLYYRDGFTLSDRLSFAGAGLTIGVGRFFFDLSGQRSNTGQASTRQFQGTALGDGTVSQVPGSLGHNHSLDSKFERDEFNATLGYGITSQFSAYVGYKHANTDLHNRLDWNWVGAPLPALDEVLYDGTRSAEFKYDGAFVGATYSLPVDSWHGNFAIQSSLAFLDGSFQESFDGDVFLVGSNSLILVDPSIRGIGVSKVTGKSRGLNLGVSWTGSFGSSKSLERLSYTIGLDRSEYDFDSPDATGDFQETGTRLRLELRYRFNVGGTAAAN
jgi:hypothetical protein